MSRASSGPGLAASALVLLGATAASGHVALLEPPARYDSSAYIKDYPCGHPDNPAGAVTRVYEEGSTITVEWNEYIGHPGHFRIALSTAGDDALVDPVDYDDFYPADNVLLDDIEDPDGVDDHSALVTLPAGVTCDKCTLQLLQIMTDKMPWGPGGGNELYYQCADIEIVPMGAGSVTAVESADGGSGSAGDGDPGCACRSSASPFRFSVLAAFCLAVCVSRRRRARPRPRPRLRPRSHPRRR